LLKTIIEPNFTYEGVIQAMVETTDGLPLDTSSTPIFATIFKDGDPYTTVRVGEGGLIEFQSLPISPTGVIYDKINVTSSFITNSPQSITFSALLTEHTKNYSVETPITVTLKTGQVSVTVNFSWAAGVTGSPRANFQTNVEGAQSGQPISITRPQTTGQATFTNVPIGKRKITCTYQGMESTTQSLLVNFSSTEDEVTVSTGTSSKTFTGSVTVNP
jgi:hypothetical protein